MYKRITLLTLCFGMFTFISCKHNGNTENANPVPNGMVRLDLSKAGIPATIDVPDTSQQQYGIESTPSGSIHVFVGGKFQLLINVSGESIAMKKSDINGNDIDKPKSWVVNDSTDLLYSTQKDTNAFPDSKEDFHFYAIVKKSKATYYVQDLEQGTDGTVYTYGKEQAQTMLTSAKSITPVTPPAKNPS